MIVRIRLYRVNGFSLTSSMFYAIRNHRHFESVVAWLALILLFATLALLGACSPSAVSAGPSALVPCTTDADCAQVNPGVNDEGFLAVRVPEGGVVRVCLGWFDDLQYTYRGVRIERYTVAADLDCNRHPIK